MPKFRFVGTDSISLFQPSERGDSMVVEPGDVITAPGELAAVQPDDAYVVGEGDSARAWPKALWELDKPATKSAPVKEN